MRALYRSFAVVCLATVSGVAACIGASQSEISVPMGDSQSFAGSWHGALTMGGSPLEVRLHITGASEAPIARLDIPSLLFAGQEIPVSIQNDVLTTTFPFGLGDVALREADGVLIGEAASVTARLQRGAAFESRAIPLSFGAREPAIMGELRLPPGDGPHPVVIVLGGSTAAMNNWSYTSWADALNRRDLAAVLYDRRADDVRDEDGALLDLHDHAADVVSAIDALSARTEIDTGRILLLGSSRGAWIAPLVGSEAADRVAGIIVTGVADVGVEEQDMQMLAAGMREDGMAEADVQDALAYARLYFAAAGDRALWPALVDAGRRAESQPWVDYIHRPQEPEELDWWAAHLDFDPAPAWRSVRAPVFAAWGGRDWVTPPHPNASLLRADLERAGIEAITRIYPSGDHRLERRFERDGDGVIWFGMAEEFFDDLDAWLDSLELIGE